MSPALPASNLCLRTRAAALYAQSLVGGRLGQRFHGSNHLSGNLGELIGPGVDDWMTIDVVDAGHDAFLEFVF